MSKTIEGKIAVDYETYCTNDDGSWNRAKQYHWHYEGVNAEFTNGVRGKYAIEVAGTAFCGGSDIHIIMALLYEAGVKSEDVVEKNVTKSIFTEDIDREDLYDTISAHVTESHYQELYDKYKGIREEFLKRATAHHDEVEKRSKESKPKQRVRRFKG